MRPGACAKMERAWQGWGWLAREWSCTNTAGACQGRRERERESARDRARGTWSNNGRQGQFPKFAVCFFFPLFSPLCLQLVAFHRQERVAIFAEVCRVANRRRPRCRPPAIQIIKEPGPEPALAGHGTGCGVRSQPRLALGLCRMLSTDYVGVGDGMSTGVSTRVSTGWVAWLMDVCERELGYECGSE